MLAAGLQPGEDQAHFHLPHDADSKPASALAWRLSRALAGSCLCWRLPFAPAQPWHRSRRPIQQIRVIGNRRIPKETILARLFTHVGDTYDPISVERDFNSLWNTAYFDDLRIEREDTEKGIILDIFVREKPNIREINYKGLSSVTVSDVLDRFKKEKVGSDGREPVRPFQDQAGRNRHQGAAGRARSPVRHHQDRGQDDSACVRAGELQHQGRPGGEGGPDQVRRQPARQRAGAAPLDEESQAHRHSVFDHLRGSVSPDLRRLKARGRHRAGAPGLSRPGLLPTPRWSSPRRRFATRAG